MLLKTTDLHLLHTNQALLVGEILKMGARVKVVDLSSELLEIEIGGKSCFLIDRMSDKNGFVATQLCADKQLSYKLLKNSGIMAPRSLAFFDHSESDLLAQVSDSQFKYPLILKPNWGSHGKGVSSKIYNTLELVSRAREFKDNYPNKAWLVQEVVHGVECRVVVVGGRVFILQKDPAFIVLKNNISIKNAIESQNQLRQEIKKSNPKAQICPILVDDDLIRVLGRQGLSLSSTLQSVKKIQKSNKNSSNAIFSTSTSSAQSVVDEADSAAVKVTLRDNANLATGGSVRVVKMGDIHSNWRGVFLNIKSLFSSLDIIGLDVIAKDWSVAPQKQEWAVIEINTQPGLAMHHYPSAGAGQNVARALAKEIIKKINTGV